MTSFLRSAVAAVSLTLTAAAVNAPASASAEFDDVDSGTWYSEPVSWLVSEGITYGTSPGCFSPRDEVTRGQVVTFLFRLDHTRGNEPQRGEHPFTDIEREYQQAPVGWAYANDITTGTSPDTFSPNAPVTREDFAVLLWRYAGRPTGAEVHPFDDVTHTDEYQAIGWMAAASITNGTSPTTYDPAAAVTRAEAATFLHRFMDRPRALTPTTADPVETQTCVDKYAELLIGAGLTTTEADCAAPFLTDLTLDELGSVLTGAATLDRTLVGQLSEIINAGCIPTVDRQAALVRALL